MVILSWLYLSIFVQDTSYTLAMSACKPFAGSPKCPPNSYLFHMLVYGISIHTMISSFMTSDPSISLPKKTTSPKALNWCFASSE